MKEPRKCTRHRPGDKEDENTVNLEMGAKKDVIYVNRFWRREEQYQML